MVGGISIDIGVSTWEKLLNATVGKILPKFNSAVFKAADNLLEKIKEYTPVGNPDLWHPPYWPKNYVPGALKAGWELSIEGSIITISNKLPYAYRVEYLGWSYLQAPEGMMRRALFEYPNIVKRSFSETGL